MSDFYDEIVDPIMGRPMVYDKAGQPISLRRMGELRWNDADGKVSDYARIGYDEVGDVEVSTVWLGNDHGFPEWHRGEGYRPVIFETMIFGLEDEGGDHPMTRYCTEVEARAGHERVVADLRAGREPWFIADE